MPVKKINKIDIFYKEAGSGDAILFIHGHPFDHTMWDPQADFFSTRYHVITPDLRGYGKSTLPQAAPTRFEDYATDMLELMSALSVERFHLVGLSQGGQIIMEIFRQAPGRIKSLVFADTFAGLDTPDAKRARYEAADKLEKEGMDGYADEVIYKMIRAEHVSTQPKVAAHVLKMMKATKPEGAATAMRARCERIDYLNLVLPQIDIPTLVIVGRQDEFTPVAKAEELRQNMPNCKMIIIEDAGHMPNLEHPEEFNLTLSNFFDGITHRSHRSL
ncbi:MAG TPA: alpha/beta fold hydrolase [Mucilaginibacter sp.]|nr:alpha/beta fold hydrolase [Mucilaginibacter sp.]